MVGDTILVESKDNSILRISLGDIKYNLSNARDLLEEGKFSAYRQLHEDARKFFEFTAFHKGEYSLDYPDLEKEEKPTGYLGRAVKGFLGFFELYDDELEEMESEFKSLEPEKMKEYFDVMDCSDLYEIFMQIEDDEDVASIPVEPIEMAEAANKVKSLICKNQDHRKLDYSKLNAGVKKLEELGYKNFAKKINHIGEYGLSIEGRDEVKYFKRRLKGLTKSKRFRKKHSEEEISEVFEIADNIQGQFEDAIPIIELHNEQIGKEVKKLEDMRYKGVANVINEMVFDQDYHYGKLCLDNLREQLDEKSKIKRNEREKLTGIFDSIDKQLNSAMGLQTRNPISYYLSKYFDCSIGLHYVDNFEEYEEGFMDQCLPDMKKEIEKRNGAEAEIELLNEARESKRTLIKEYGTHINPEKLVNDPVKYSYYLLKILDENKTLENKEKDEIKNEIKEIALRALELGKQNMHLSFKEKSIMSRYSGNGGGNLGKTTFNTDNVSLVDGTNGNDVIYESVPFADAVMIFEKLRENGMLDLRGRML